MCLTNENRKPFLQEAIGDCQSVVDVSECKRTTGLVRWGDEDAMRKRNSLKRELTYMCNTDPTLRGKNTYRVYSFDIKIFCKHKTKNKDSRKKRGNRRKKTKLEVYEDIHAHFHDTCEHCCPQSGNYTKAVNTIRAQWKVDGMKDFICCRYVEKTQEFIIVTEQCLKSITATVFGSCQFASDTIRRKIYVNRIHMLHINTVIPDREITDDLIDFFSSFVVRSRIFTYDYLLFPFKETDVDQLAWSVTPRYRVFWNTFDPMEM